MLNVHFYSIQSCAKQADIHNHFFTTIGSETAKNKIERDKRNKIDDKQQNSKDITCRLKIQTIRYLSAISQNRGPK